MIQSADYKKTGGWEEAIALDADRVLQQFTPLEQDAVKLVFQRITEKGTGDRPIRTPCSFGELVELTRSLVTPARLREILTAFQARDLLVWETEERIDIPHECVTWRWGRLANWIEEEDQDARRLAFIVDSARKKTPLAGSALEEARVLRGRIADPWVGRYKLDAGELTRWIDHSEHEATKARLLARILAFGLGVVAVVFLALAVWALRHKRQAEKAAEEARKQAMLAKKANDEARVAELAAREAERAAFEAQIRAELANAEAVRERDNAIGEKKKAVAARSSAEKAREDTANANSRSKNLTMRLLVGQADKLRSDPDSLNLSLLLAIHAVRVSVEDKLDSAFQASQSLSEGLRLLSERPLTLTTPAPEAAAISPNGRYFASGSRTQLRIWEVDRLREAESGDLAPLQSIKHPGPLVDLQFSPDSAYVATSSTDAVVRVWDVATGALLKPELKPAVVEPQSGLRAIAFPPASEARLSSDRLLLATADARHRIRVWDVREGREICDRCEMKHDDRVNSIAFDPKQRFLLSGSQDGVAKLWKIGDLAAEPTPIKHAAAVDFVTFSADGDRFAVAGGTTVQVFRNELPLGPPVPIEHEREGVVRSVAFSRTGKLIATGTETGVVKIVRLGEKLVTRTVKHDQRVDRVEYSADDLMLATVSRDGTAKVWSTDQGREITQMVLSPKPGSNGTVLAFSPDGQVVVAAARTSGEVRFKMVPQPVIALASDSERGTMVTAHRNRADPTITVRFQSSKETKWHKLAGTQSASRIAMSSNGKFLVTAQSGKGLVWDLAATQPTSATIELPAQIERAVIADDGRRVAVVSGGKLLIREIRSGSDAGPVATDGRILSLAFSRDSRLLAVGSTSGLTVWDVQSREVVVRPTGAPPADAVAFDVEGKRVAAAISNQTVMVWDSSGQAVAPALRHDVNVTSIVFSPDGSHLGTAGGNQARVWELPSGKELSRNTYAAAVSGIGFTLDGRFLATGSADGTLRREPWRSEDLIAEACRHVEGTPTGEEWKEYIGDPPLRSHCGTEVDLRDVLELADAHAESGNRDQAAAAFRQAVQMGNTSDWERLNDVCWLGIIHGFAGVVLKACEDAVAKAKPGNIYAAVTTRDSRGIALALLGRDPRDLKIAVEDFSFYATNGSKARKNPEDIEKRRRWADALAKGDNPFKHPAELEGLR